MVTTDASPQMVARCREKGLDAHVMDFMSLCLAGFVRRRVCVELPLHVRNADLPPR